MTRKEKLEKYLKEKAADKFDIINPLIDDVIFLESQLESLKKYTFLKVHPSDPTMQKVTPAGKQYKDLTQTYINLIKVLISVTEKDGGQEDSPLREYMRKLNTNG